MIPESSEVSRTHTALPEVGQLVEVRRRQWIVADVQPSLIHEGLSSHSTLIKLTSIDEDALGEELTVFWEIEPGAQVIEKAGLPKIEGQDDTRTLEAFLDAVRWGAATNTVKGFLQAPFRSGVSIEDFQLDPLVRAIELARVNLLIADDVGLGKTIEAGLVIQELFIRHRIRTVLIVCPASLQEKWRIEMVEKFGLEFKIVNSESLKFLRRKRGVHANPWSSFPRLITSMDWLKSGEALSLFRDLLPTKTTYPRKFDMLIVDEAHNVAPVGSKNYVLESQRTQLIRRISPHFQNRIFLTATPHNGYTQSFTSLLELLDDQRFSRNIEPDEKVLSQVMIRRLKTDIVDKDGNPRYPKRILHPLEIHYTNEERKIQESLFDYCKSRERTCREQGGHAAAFINDLLKKRLLSSPASFFSTLEKHYETVTRGGRKVESSTLTDRILRKAILKADEDYADDGQFEVAQSDAIEVASKRIASLTSEEVELMDEMRNWASENLHRKDSKAAAIIEWIEKNLKSGGEWNQKRVILFTEYRTTLDWLNEILASHNYGGERLLTIHGGIDQQEREKIKAAFQTNPEDSPVRILLATDAASEGIDLQNHCSHMIHVEIPYNPNVMEQRNGRIDRHGQREKEVSIWHPVDGGFSASKSGLVGHKDDIIRALRKLDAMRKDMGSVNPVIAPQMADLLEGRIKEIDTSDAEYRSEKARKFIKAERDLKEKISKLHSDLEDTREEFHLTPERIKQTVDVGLKLAVKAPLEVADLRGVERGSVFKMPHLDGSWSRCLEGLNHPHTGKIRPITFDHEIAKDRDDVVLVHLNHRLVQMCLRLLRSEIWASEGKKLHRVDIRQLPDSELQDPAVLVVSRLVITGGKFHRLHEELTFSAGYLRERGFARETGVEKIKRWYEIATSHKAPENILDLLKKRFQSNENSIVQMVEARSKDRLNFLEKTLETRKKQEIKNIEKILDELSQAIRKELEEQHRPEQLELWSPDERTHIKRDYEMLKMRHSQIPEEKKMEVQEIEKRYREFDARTFPVAVIFLIPESLKLS